LAAPVSAFLARDFRVASKGPYSYMFIKYINTLKHLKAVQFYGRLWHMLYRPARPSSFCVNLRPISGAFTRFEYRQNSISESCVFDLLCEKGALEEIGWVGDQRSMLWRYNQHYFDDLNACGSGERRVLHRFVIDHWIGENKFGEGCGWDSYPTSLRIVNWIKLHLKYRELSGNALESLFEQSHWLSGRLEYHLLGNHLFANAKALVFAGLFFEGSAAETWFSKGSSIVLKELNRQILADGGHFELSPMYHSIILEDILDLINVLSCYELGVKGQDDFLTSLLGQVPKMLQWLDSMTHPNDEIGFFNDATLNVAPTLSQLVHYRGLLAQNKIAIKLDDINASEHIASKTLSCKLLDASGYVRVDLPGANAILDVGKVGPEYLPGHAHADTLSFELTISKTRVLVNSGVSLYVVGQERLRQRGTAAHNTCIVGDVDSSEVWSAFRVSRRAYPFDLKIDKAEERAVKIECSHDGYRRLTGRPMHKRVWAFEGECLVVEDWLEGKAHNCKARYHLHPDLTIVNTHDCSRGEIFLGSKAIAEWIVELGEAMILKSSFHPALGVTQENICLQINLNESRSRLRIIW
jgi:uncharacterized heparinase superfamily protein